MKIIRGYASKPHSVNVEKGLTLVKVTSTGEKVYNTPLCTLVDNFYNTDFVSETSAIMAKVSKTSRENKKYLRQSIYS